jgi:hypothetical protein
MKKPYEAPAVRELGSLRDLTEQLFNKVGTTPDLLSTIENGIVGSLVPAS